MKASYRKRNNRHHIRYRDRANPEHKEFVESFDASKISKKDVQAKIDHINYKIKFQGFNPWAERKKNKEEQKITIPLQMAIDKFIEANISAGNWMDRTKENYEEYLKKLTNHFGKGISLEELNQSKLQDWLNRHPVSPNSKDSYARKINTFFKWIFENNYTNNKWEIGITPLEKKQLENNDRIKYLTYQELSNITKGYLWQVSANRAAGFIRDYFDQQRHPDIWWFMFWQMLRKSELPKIRRNDVDFENNRVRIHGKGGKIEWMYLTPPARPIIKRRLKTNSDPVFGIAPGSERIYKNFFDACRLALGSDHPAGLHQLRHGGAVHYISLGKPVQFVSKMMRHETIAVTMEIYADVLPDKIEEAFGNVTDSPVF